MAEISAVTVTDDTISPTVIEVSDVALAGFDRDKVTSVEFGAQRNQDQVLRLAMETDEHYFFHAREPMQTVGTAPYALPEGTVEPVSLAGGGIIELQACGIFAVTTGPTTFTYRLRARNDLGEVTLHTFTHTESNTGTGAVWEYNGRLYVAGPEAQVLVLEFKRQIPGIPDNLSEDREGDGTIALNTLLEGEISFWLEIEVSDASDSIQVLAYHIYQKGVKDGVLY